MNVKFLLHSCKISNKGPSSRLAAFLFMCCPGDSLCQYMVQFLVFPSSLDVLPTSELANDISRMTANC